MLISLLDGVLEDNFSEVILIEVLRSSNPKTCFIFAQKWLGGQSASPTDILEQNHVLWCGGLKASLRNISEKLIYKTVSNM